MKKKPINDKKPKDEINSRQNENIKPHNVKTVLQEMIKDSELKAILIGSFILALVFLLL